MHLTKEDKPFPAVSQGACLRFTPTSVIGAMMIDPIRREDNRGYFARKWCLREFAEHGIDFVPLQASNASNLRKGTVRGMHFQAEPALEAKLDAVYSGAHYSMSFWTQTGFRTM